MNNNQDKNRKYFKDTFSIFQAPNNVAQEVFNMAKNLDKNSSSNNKQVITSQVETVKHNHFGRFIAVACACVLIVGSGVYLNSIGGNQVSTNIGASDNDTIKTSNQNQINTNYFDILKNSASDLKSAITYKDASNGVFGIYDINEDIINKIYDICISQEWTMSNEPVIEENQKYNSIILCSGYTAKSNSIELNSDIYIDIYTDGSIYINDDKNSIYLNLIHNENGSKFCNEILKLLSEETTMNTVTIDNKIPWNDLIRYNKNICTSVNAEIIDNKNGNNTTPNLTLTDIDYLNSDIIDCTEVAYQDISYEKYQELLPSNFDETIKLYICDNNQTLVSYDICADYILVSYDDENSNTITSMCYIDGSIYDKISNYLKLKNDENKLFGVIEMSSNAWGYADSSTINSGRGFQLDTNTLQEINALSNVSAWEKVEENPIVDGVEYKIIITIEDDTHKIEIKDSHVAVTYEDGSKEYYNISNDISNNDLAQNIYNIINPEMSTQNIDDAKLFGIIPMDEYTTAKAVNYYSNGDEISYQLTYQNLLEINQWFYNNEWKFIGDEEEDNSIYSDEDMDSSTTKDGYASTIIWLSNNYSFIIYNNGSMFISQPPKDNIDEAICIKIVGENNFSQYIEELYHK